MSEKPIPIRGEQIDLEDAIAAAPVVKDEQVTLYRGDCLEVLRNLPDMGVDAVVTDPPAGIGFMGKEWDDFRRSRNAADAGRDSVHGRTSRTGPEYGRSERSAFIAFMTAVMVECFRVLKPGGHALVWAIPRTSHWTATAIEDAGFEVRDVITHHFGSGFPKSLDVSKAIDKSTVRDRETGELKFRGFTDDIYRVTAFIATARDGAGKNNADIDAHMGFVGMAGHWTSSKSQPAVPQWEQWLKLKELLVFGDEMDAEVWRLNGRKGKPGEGWTEREITGQHENAPAAQTWKANYGLAADLDAKERRDEPATAAAATWQGWGTALKPASEHWILARRPLSETNVAANVLRHGTGALNIDACRIDTGGEEVKVALADPANRVGPVGATSFVTQKSKEGMHAAQLASIERTNRLGRWPANLALSHSAACRQIGTRIVKREQLENVLGGPAVNTYGDGFSGSRALPPTTQKIGIFECAADCPVAELDRQSGEAGGAAPASGPTLTGGNESVARGRYNGTDAAPAFYADHGGASRFFYTAKASPSERNAGLAGLASGVGAMRDGGRGKVAANTHPTVKSTDLMRWLCRLITPPRGVVLDPFMGSGSTGVAAKLEDFRFIGIEREEEYMEIAKRRLGWATAQPALFDLDDVKTHAA